jgi:hypothetical protein
LGSDRHAYSVIVEYLGEQRLDADEQRHGRSMSASKSPRVAEQVS